MLKNNFVTISSKAGLAISVVGSITPNFSNSLKLNNLLNIIEPSIFSKASNLFMSGLNFFKSNDEETRFKEIKNYDVDFIKNQILSNLDINDGFLQKKNVVISLNCSNNGGFFLSAFDSSENNSAILKIDKGENDNFLVKIAIVPSLEEKEIEKQVESFTEFLDTFNEWLKCAGFDITAKFDGENKFENFKLQKNNNSDDENTILESYNNLNHINEIGTIENEEENEGFFSKITKSVSNMISSTKNDKMNEIDSSDKDVDVIHENFVDNLPENKKTSNPEINVPEQKIRIYEGDSWSDYAVKNGVVFIFSDPRFEIDPFNNIKTWNGIATIWSETEIYNFGGTNMARYLYRKSLFEAAKLIKKSHNNKNVEALGERLNIKKKAMNEFIKQKESNLKNNMNKRPNEIDPVNQTKESNLKNNINKRPNEINPANQIYNLNNPLFNNCIPQNTFGINNFCNTINNFNTK